MTRREFGVPHSAPESWSGAIRPCGETGPAIDRIRSAAGPWDCADWMPRGRPAGLTLFAPMMGDGAVHLIDLNGKIVHTWRMPYRPALWLHHQAGHSLLQRKNSQRYISGAGAVQGRSSAGGRLERPNSLGGARTDHHHVRTLLKNGNVLLLCASECRDSVAKKDPRWTAGHEVNARMWPTTW